MRSSEFRNWAPLAAAFAAGLGFSIAALAQDDAADAQSSQRANAAIIERYMTNVQAELDSKLDSKSATVGQEVTARTDDAATLADGTPLPRGTKLVGHVTRVAAQTRDQPVAMLALAFDRAQLKDGSSVALRSEIRTVAPAAGHSTGMPAAGPARGSGMGGGSMGGPMMGGTPSGPMDTGIDNGGMPGGGMGGTGSSGGMGGGNGTAGTRGGGGLGDGQGGMGGNLPGPSTRTIGQRTGLPDALSTAGGGTMPVTQAGETTSTAPRPSGLPGVMLSNQAVVGVSVLLASGQNISLNSGTRVTLGVISNQARPAQ